MSKEHFMGLYMFVCLIVVFFAAMGPPIKLMGVQHKVIVTSHFSTTEWDNTSGRMS
jgi:hypothetical protein